MSHRDSDTSVELAESDGSSAPPSPSPRARIAFAGAVFGTICLGCGPWMVRLADVGPLASSFWRLAIAAPLLPLIALGARQPIRRMPRAMWGLLAVAGLFFAADLASWHLGIVRTRLANATLFANLTGFLFAIYGFILARALPARHQAGALVLAALGVLLLLGRSYELSPRHLTGDLLSILAALFYLGYLVAMERVRLTLPPLPALAVATFIGAPLLLGLALAAGDVLWPRDWAPLLFLAFGGQIVGQGLIIFAIPHLPPIVTGLILLLQPAVGATIGWIAYGERLQGLDWVGVAMIATALVLVRWGMVGPARGLPQFVASLFWRA